MRKRMTVKEATELFFENTISKELLYREIRNGSIPHVKLSEGKILLDVEELESWWQSQLTRSKQHTINNHEDAELYGKLRKIAE